MDTDHSNVALSEEYVEKHNLPKDTVRFPWDQSKRLYILKVFHHAHCLVSASYSVPQSGCDLSSEIKLSVLKAFSRNPSANPSSAPNEAFLK